MYLTPDIPLPALTSAHLYLFGKRVAAEHRLPLIKVSASLFPTLLRENEGWEHKGPREGGTGAGREMPTEDSFAWDRKLMKNPTRRQVPFHEIHPTRTWQKRVQDVRVRGRRTFFLAQFKLAVFRTCKELHYVVAGLLTRTQLYDRAKEKSSRFKNKMNAFTNQTFFFTFFLFFIWYKYLWLHLN